VKTGLLAYAEDDLAAALRKPRYLSARKAAALVSRVHPGYDVERISDGTLLDGVYPPDDVVYAAALRGADVVSDQRFMIDHPSRLPERLLELAAGRTIVLHAMHSVADWLAFGLWRRGELIRSLSVSPDSGIIENIGEPLEFERPFWAGEHAIKDDFSGGERDLLPFHPLELGEEALRALCGFVIEGVREPADVDPDDIHMYGFRVVDPSGAEREGAAAR
jgi:hypothetical protein